MLQVPGVVGAVVLRALCHGELSPIWTGAPLLQDAVVYDYDNFNTAWSGGDGIAIVFDRKVNDGQARRKGGLKQGANAVWGFFGDRLA